MKYFISFFLLFLVGNLYSEVLFNPKKIGIIISKRSSELYTIQVFEKQQFFLLKEMPKTILYILNKEQEVELCLKAVHYYEYDLKYYIHSLQTQCKDIVESKKNIQMGDFVYIEGVSSSKQTEYITKKMERKKILFHPIDFKEMIYVEGDYLLFGQGIDPEDSSFNLYYYDWNLENLARIGSFYMDKYEVTNYEFLTFCKKANYLCPKFLYNLSEEENDLPFIYATYKDVEEYAKWSKKQIPTEWEWELAAKGGISVFLNSTKIFSKTLFDEYPTQIDNCNTLEKWEKDPKPISVYKLKDINFRGIVGMCGNALEWTSSYFLPYPGNRFKNKLDKSLSGKFFRVLRGGGFFLPSEYAKVYKRIVGGSPEFQKDPVGGFRLILRTK